MLDFKNILSDEEAKQIILTLYDTGHGVASRVIGSILGSQISQEEKEDLIQEGFLKLVTHVEQLKGRTPKERTAYMARVMRTVAIDEARRRIQTRMVESLETTNYPEPESTDLTPEEFYLMREAVEEKVTRMRAALERLPERDRVLLIEKYQNGRSDAEIGSILNIKPRNVRVYLSRARHKAAMYYGEEVNGKQGKRKGSSVRQGTQRKTESKGT